jgi:hypothetical protein
MKIIDSLLHFISRIDHYIQVTENGHPEHFIVGSLIGGFISFFILKRTNDVFKALFFGIGAAILIGVLKEVIDPLIGGSRDKSDIMYTVLGGVVGTGIALYSNKRARKNIAKSS